MLFVEKITISKQLFFGHFIYTIIYIVSFGLNLRVCEHIFVTDPLLYTIYNCYLQKTCFPIVVITGRVRIHWLEVLAGL